MYYTIIENLGKNQLHNTTSPITFFEIYNIIDKILHLFTWANSLGTASKNRKSTMKQSHLRVLVFSSYLVD